MFWGLSANLAYRRHFPAIDWLVSYSLYADRLSGWYVEHAAPDFKELRAFAVRILQEESELNEIVRLVGADALSGQDRLTLETAKSIREDFLHQNAFHETDTYSSIGKQCRMLRLIREYHRLGLEALAAGAPFERLSALPVREKIGRAKYIEEGELSSFDMIFAELKQEIRALEGGEEGV